MSMAAVNVRALGPKLQTLMEWEHQVIVATEARVSERSKKTLMRVAHAHGHDIVFGKSPGASPTFSVAPGGIAVLCKKPYTLRILPNGLRRLES